MSSRQASVRCGNNVDQQTAAVRSADGVAVALRFHSEDDHGKNTHLCQSEYELQIVRPDGSASGTGWNDLSDGEWDRAITFGMEGFTADGQRAFARVSEGGRSLTLEVLVYDLHTHSDDAFSLDSDFLKKLGPCVQALHVEGLTSQGEVVVGTGPGGACGLRQRWRLITRRTRWGNNVAEPLRANAQVVPLVQGTEIIEQPADRILTKVR